MEHPGDLELQAFLAGGLPAPVRNALLLHLSLRCARCQRRLASLADRTLGPGRKEEPEAGYDDVLDRAFAAARSREEVPGGRPNEIGTLARQLLAASHALRYRDPADMIRLAELARLVASRARSDRYDRYGAAPFADLLTRVHAELGNAYRVAENLEEAERHIALAGERQREGTGDVLVQTLLLSRTAALRKDQRRPAEGARLLRRVHALYREIGERHLAGRALVGRGLYISAGGEPGKALALLVAGAAEIDPDRDPNLVVVAEQNIAWALVFTERFAEARERLRCCDLRNLHDDELLLARIGWLEGRIALGFGDRRRAETAFRETQGVFLAAGQPGNAGIVAQDLAAARTGSEPSGPTAG